MSSGIVKKARGRPPKSSITPKTEDVKSIDSNRQYARMSLRPNKRVKVSRDDMDDSDLYELNPHNEEEYVLPDEDDKDEDDFMDELIDENDSMDNEHVEGLANRDAFYNHKRRSRKMIMFNPKLAAKMRRDQLKTENTDGIESQKLSVLSSSYLQNKETICVGCSAELNQKRIDKASDLFTGLTKHGKSMKDLFSSVIKEDIDETMIGRKLCQQCVAALNNIEDLYAKFRSAADNFQDNYILGQKSIDADLAGFEEVSDLTSIMGALSLPLSDIVIKVLDDSVDTFDAYAVGHSDFNCQVLKVYAGSIQSSGTMPNPEPADDNNDMITITFDYATGAISRADSYSRAQLNMAQLDEKETGVVLYMIDSEFEALNKVQAEEKVFISLEEFSRLVPTVILGHKTTWLQMILSNTLANEYKRLIPSAQHSFCCCDCGASFHHLHMLTNHVQVAHVDPPKDSGETIETKNGDQISLVKGDEDATRTGEVSSLEKPFQCEICDKCFAHYMNYSNHVEHYHGFNRKCNLQNCDTNTKSIQEFVQHYVRHINPEFLCPTDFNEKKSIGLPCPHCSSMINGIWRLFNHSFIHDAQPRFKCPVCPKRFAKVQNFKLHIIKHVAPSNTKVKHCRHCNQLVPNAEFSKHLQEKHEVVLPYQCGDCNQAFSRMSFLRAHQEKHLAKPDWIWICRTCPQTFPSESKLLSHEANQHPIELSQCRHCEQGGFTSKLDLIMHESHNHTKKFACSVCQFRDKSVLACRSHYRDSHPDKPLYCHQCQNYFENIIHVHHHLLSHHENLVGKIQDGQQEFICLLCQKESTTVLSLLQHLRTEHLSQTIDTSTIDYEKQANEFGDHIIEYATEDSNEVVRFYSVL